MHATTTSPRDDEGPEPAQRSSPVPRPRRRWFLMGASAIGLAAALVMAAAIALAQDSKHVLPPPTGRLPIGRTTFYWRDAARAEPATADPHDQRELRVDLWYPAAPAPDAQAARYCPDFDAIKGHLGLERLVAGNVVTDAFEGPPLAAAARRYPVVLLSPGFDTNATSYAALVEELVSHGYVVAAVDHPFQSKAIAYPDGRVAVVAQSDRGAPPDPARFEQEYRARVQARVADLRFVADQLARLDSGVDDRRFAGRLDF